MEILRSLEEIGLNEKQAKIYLSVVEIGPATALEISRHSHIKRSTVYVVLDELKYQKLITEIQKGSTAIFLAEKPEVLGNQIERQLDTFQSIKPLLDDLYLKEGTKPSVTFYFGRDDIEKLYERIMKENGRLQFFGTDMERFTSAFPELTKIITSYISAGKHNIRELVTDNPYNREYAKRNYHARFHHIRIIPDNYMFFGDNALYGNTLLITSPSEPFSVTIESKDVQRTFSTLFQIAWDISKAPRDLRKKK